MKAKRAAYSTTVIKYNNANYISVFKHNFIPIQQMHTLWVIISYVTLVPRRHTRLLNREQKTASGNVMSS